MSGCSTQTFSPPLWVGATQVLTGMAWVERGWWGRSAHGRRGCMHWLTKVVFQLPLEQNWHLLPRSSLLAWWEWSDLSGFEPGSPPRDSCLAIMNPIWSEWAWALWPPFSSVFWLPLKRLSLPVWLSWEPSDPSGLEPDGPPWIVCKFPLESPRESFVGRPLHIFIYFVHCKFFCLLLIEYSVSLFSNYCQCCISDPGNVF